MIMSINIFNLHYILIICNYSFIRVLLERQEKMVNTPRTALVVPRENQGMMEL